MTTYEAIVIYNTGQELVIELSLKFSAENDIFSLPISQGTLVNFNQHEVVTALILQFW